MHQTANRNRKTRWIALALCIGVSCLAAEKNRDWQTGQVVQSKAQDDPRIHAIAGSGKTYVVRGTAGAAEGALAIGATVRFAVEGSTMYLSIAGSEYKLSVLGATVNPSAPAPVAAAAAPSASSPPPAAAPPAPAPAATPPPPAKAGKPLLDQAPLDNDAVVKMIVGGLKEDTVISVIEARPGKYSLNLEARAALQAAGVPPRVIGAMSAKMAAQQH